MTPLGRDYRRDRLIDFENDIVNKVHCSECVDFMENYIPNESIDLVVTSPPYDNMRDYKGYDFNFKSIAKELGRVLKPGGVIVWVVGDATIKGSETGTSFRQALYFLDEVGLRLHDTMAYHKTGVSFPTKSRYNQIFEYMFVFSNGTPKTFNPICDVEKKWKGSWGKTNVRQKDGSLKPFNSMNEGLAKMGKSEGEARYGYKMRDNVWVIANGKGHGQKNKEAYKHPATFPESLAEDHILSWSNPGDIVLDPMCGSGTTCHMARRNGRKFIGIDISQEYIDLCERRLLNV